MPAIAAGIVGTSLASTAGNDVTIGEVVRYRIAAEIPFDNAQYSSLDLSAFLPAGLNFLNDGTARIALVSNDGIVSSLAPAGSNLYFVGDESNLASITPTFNVTPSILSGGRVLVFSAGNLNVLDNDLNSEYVLIEFNALVTNFEGGAATAAGASLDTTFQLFVGGDPFGNATGGAALNVVEPSITNMSKVANHMTFGNQQGVRYTISFTNSGDSIAYDVLVRDFIPAGLNFNPQSLQVVGGTGVSIGATLTSFEVRFDQIAVGATVTITYDVLFDGSVVNGQQFTNTANIDYTSLPGAHGENPNPTGSVTPGTPGMAEGERDGSGGFNGYFGAAAASITYGTAGGATLSGYVKCVDTLAGINGVTIRLYDANGALIATTVTAFQAGIGDGYYEFTGLPQGVYTILQDDNNLPAGVTDANIICVGTINGQTVGTAGQDPQGNDIIFGIVLKPGDVGVFYDFSDYCTPPQDKARISGFVFVDMDDDCVFDPGEAPIAGVRMELLDANGNVIAVTFTDATGFYQFLDLLPGVYTVRQQPQNEAPLDIYDDGCDMPGTTGGDGGANMGRGRLVDTISNIPVQAGQHSQFNNFGEIPKPAVGQLSGFVFCDDNANGRLDPGEHVFANVLIRLTGGLLGVPLFALTNANGQYSFTDLSPGTYQINMVDVPPPFLENGVRTVPLNVFNAVPGTINGVTVGVGTISFINNVALPAGASSIHNDFPLLCVSQLAPVSISGQTFYDPNGDCIFNSGDSPIAGVQIRAVGTDGNGNVILDQTTTTDANGRYGFVFHPGVVGQLFRFRIIISTASGFILEGVMAGDFGGRVIGNEIVDIDLTDGNDAVGYDGCFIRENPPPPTLPSKLDFLANGGQGTGGPGTGVGGAIDFGQVATAPDFNDINVNTRPGVRYLVTGAGEGGGPHVRVFDFITGREVFSFMAYDQAFRGGVRVASGDVNGDGVADIITAPGFGGGPVIRIFDGVTGLMLTEFNAYDPSFRGGVYIAVGDVNGDGRAEIITGAGEGGAAHVKVFTVNGVGSNIAAVQMAEFMAYDPAFRGGVRVAAADFNRDGFADVVTGAGIGGGPHVKIFDLRQPLAGGTFAIVNQFMAFDSNFRGGIFVAAGGIDRGDVSGDGIGDLVVGMGAGGASVRVFSGVNFAILNQFEVFGGNYDNGARVAISDLNGDGQSDVVAASGSGSLAFVRVINLAINRDFEFFAPYGAFTGGAFVGAS